MYMQLIYMLNVEAFSAVHAFQMTPYRHRRTTSKSKNNFSKEDLFEVYLFTII